MTVAEAIELLQRADPNAILLVSSDEEGNSYRRASIGGNETFCDQDGDFVSIHPEDLAAGEYEGWEDKMFSAVVIW